MDGEKRYFLYHAYYKIIQGDLTASKKSEIFDKFWQSCNMLLAN